MGRAYRFTTYPAPSRPLIAVTVENADLLQAAFADMVDELPSWQPFLAIVEDGRAVAICRRVRITPDAHEAGVETMPAYRGRGYAVDVVAGWAARVAALGALPMHSTSWDNRASQSVARRLRLAQYGADFHIS